MALEIRQKESLQATFSVIDTHTGELLLPDFKTPERWWTGMEDAFGGNLFFHGFSQNRETGKHQGITAVSEKNGSVNWQMPELRFIGVISERTLIAENVSGVWLEIEMSSGNEKAFLQPREYAKNQLRALEEKRNQAMQFPVPYLPADAHYQLLQQFIKQKTGKTPEQTIEYLESGSKIIMSFYARNHSVLANYLVVCSAAGEVLLNNCLEPNVTGLGLDTFFIFATKLFFIQEKNGLACFLL